MKQSRNLNLTIKYITFLLLNCNSNMTSQTKYDAIKIKKPSEIINTESVYP